LRRRWQRARGRRCGAVGVGAHLARSKGYKKNKRENN